MLYFYFEILIYKAILSGRWCGYIEMFSLLTINCFFSAKIVKSNLVYMVYLIHIWIFLNNLSTIYQQKNCAFLFQLNCIQYLKWLI